MRKLQYQKLFIRTQQYVQFRMTHRQLTILPQNICVPTISLSSPYLRGRARTTCHPQTPRPLLPSPSPPSQLTPNSPLPPPPPSPVTVLASLSPASTPAITAQMARPLLSHPNSSCNIVVGLPRAPEVAPERGGGVRQSCLPTHEIGGWWVSVISEFTDMLG